MPDDPRPGAPGEPASYSLWRLVDGVTAAAIGAISGAVIVLARRSLIDAPTVLIALATVVLLWQFRKLQEPVIVAAAALIGLLIHPLLR